MCSSSIVAGVCRGFDVTLTPPRLLLLVRCKYDGARCEKMKVYAYHGGNRSQDVDFLASCDVVGDRASAVAVDVATNCSYYVLWLHTP